MRRVLFVDDDPIVLRVYQNGLSRRGFEVTTASDGLGAIQALRSSTPDVVVLDLMMPKFSGAEVLKYIRDQKQTASLPVIVLSNAYMDPLAQDAAKLGAQKGLLKVKCNPVALALAITELLEGQASTATVDHLLAAAADPTPVQKETPGVLEASRPAEPPPPTSGTATDSREQARQELSARASGVARSLGEACQALLKAREIPDRNLRLEDLYRKVHFLAALAGLADYQSVSQMASALEALLFNQLRKRADLEPSLSRTIRGGVEFLQALLQDPPALPAAPQPTPWALVVDDDRVSNRLVVSALRNAQLQARGAETPELALRLLQEQQYDVILLDVEMPGMDGIELCKRLRALPNYGKTPVIYVTLHSDFETRAKTLISGGNDLIAKPVVPTELAVKAVMYLLKVRQQPQPS